MNENEWRVKLSPEQFSVLREGATEAPFTGEYNSNKKEGAYKCGGCGEKLFMSDKKFDSGSGWPSFTEAAGQSVEEKSDASHGMVRTEILCTNCGGTSDTSFQMVLAPTACATVSTPSRWTSSQTSSYRSYCVSPGGRSRYYQCRYELPRVHRAEPKSVSAMNKRFQAPDSILTIARTSPTLIRIHKELLINQEVL